MNAVGFVLTSPLLLMGIGAGAWALRRYRYAIAIEHGEEVPGRVVAFEEVELISAPRPDAGAFGEPRFVRVAVVEFADAAGRRYRKTGMEGTGGRSLRIGSDVRVRYPIGDPERASVVGENNLAISAAIAAFAVFALLAWVKLNF